MATRNDPGTTQAPNRHPADRRRRGPDLPRRAEDNSRLLEGAVSFRMRRLEPLLAWVIAGATLWINILLSPSGATVWWMALFAACIGGWSGMLPARTQGVMLARSLLLITGAFLLHVAPDTGGASGPYLLWPVLITAFYALLLSPPWATLLALLALLEFALSCWVIPVRTSWQLGLAYAGFLVAIPVLSIEFGRSLRASDDRAEAALRDGRTMLYNESGFFVHGAVLLAECRKSARPFCMVLLNGTDLLGIPELLGRKVANELFSQAVQAIGAIPGEGIAARVDTVEFALLLPGVSSERASALVKQRLGDPPKLEVQLNGKPIIVVLDMALAQPRSPEQTIEELYDSLHLRRAAKTASSQGSKVAAMLDLSDTGVTELAL